MAKQVRGSYSRIQLPWQGKAISILLFVLAFYIIVSVLVMAINLDGKQLAEQLKKDNPAKYKEYEIRYENNGWGNFNETGFGQIFYIMIIAGIAVGIFVALLGLFFWRGKNWARITIIVFAFITAFFSLISIILRDYWSLIDGAVSLTLAIYLLKNKKIKAFFKR